MGMAWLFLMHLGVVGLRRMHYQTSNNAFRTLLEVFGGLWLVVPLLASSVSVAEERKLGTLAEQLSLPVSRRIQFALKLLFTLVIGGLLSALLLCTAEGIGTPLAPAAACSGQKVSGTDLACLVLVFVGFAFLGFYASTLARNVVQALAGAVVSTVAIWAPGRHRPPPGRNPAPAAVARVPHLLLRLARAAGGLALAGLAQLPVRIRQRPSLAPQRPGSRLGPGRRDPSSLSAIYHRFWELLTPVDPPPGVTQITGTKPVILRSSDGRSLTAILSDGRLWVDRIGYDPGRLLLRFGEETGFRTGGKWTS